MICDTCKKWHYCESPCFTLDKAPGYEPSIFKLTVKKFKRFIINKFKLEEEE